MARETWVQSQVESYQRLKKWYLMPPCLTLSIIRHGSRVKWSNPGKGVAPFPTPWCSSYRKGSLRVTLDYGRQLYFVKFHLKISVWIKQCSIRSNKFWITYTEERRSKYYKEMVSPKKFTKTLKQLFAHPIVTLTSLESYKEIHYHHTCLKSA